MVGVGRTNTGTSFISEVQSIEQNSPSTANTQYCLPKSFIDNSSAFAVFNNVNGIVYTRHTVS